MDYFYLTKHLKLLDLNFRRKFLLIIFLMIIGALLEMFSIGMLIPFVSIIVDTDNQSTKLFKNFLDFINPNISKDKFLTISFIFFLMLFFFKFTYMVIFLYFKNLFIMKVRDNLSTKMYTNYLYKPYSFYQNENSSKLLLNCKSEVDNYSHNVLNGCLELFTELFVIIGLFILVIIVSPKLFILISVVGLVFFLSYQKLLKKRTIIWGQERFNSDKDVNKNLIQSFGSIKEIIINSKQNFFIKKLKTFLRLNSVVSVRQMTFIEIPRYFMEFIAILFFICFIIYLNFSNQDILPYLPTLGLYAAVAFKLLPAINRILSSLQRLRYSNVSVDIIYNHIFNKNIDTKSNEFINHKNSFKEFSKIKLENITYKYPASEKYIFKNINLEINKNDIVGIMGESGVGKSTLLNLITTLEQDYSGKILVNDKDLKNISYDWKNLIGFVPQNPYILDDTVEKNIAFGFEEEEINHELKIEVMKTCELHEYIQNLPNNYKTQMGERGIKFSGGQLQRLSIARALYKKPKILILDEATNALDLENEKKIIKQLSLSQYDLTFILVSHKTTLLDFSTKVYKLENNKLDIIYDRGK